MSSTAAPRPTLRPSEAVLRLLRSQYLVLVLSILWFASVLPFAPAFASAANLTNILAAMLPLLVLATGQTLVLVTGGIDLSITSTVAFASIVGGLVMNADTGLLAGHALAVPGGIAAMIVAGAAVGAFNGAAIALVRMPPFIVTLTTMMFVGGFAVWLTKSQAISGLPPAFNAIGGRLAPALGVTLGVAIVAHLALGRTLFGRWVYAVGHNPRAAVVSGVPTRGTTVAVYVASGVCAALAAVLYTGRLETASPVLAQRMLLDVIGATVIGGTSLYGGKGRVLWTVFGVLFFTLIDNSLNLLNLSYFAIMMVKGGVILIAALIDVVRHGGATAS